MPATTFPADTWQRDDSATESLAPVKAWLDETARGRRYRVVIVRGGRLLAEWCQGVGAEEQLGLASAAKPVFSCMLAIAVEERKIESPDAKVVEVYPEMMNVPDGTGPKPGRYAFPEDAGITFRQLICNTSGYMKPGEEPGRVHHYQTYGMNILTHAIAKAYGHYSSENAENSPGLEPLVTEKLRDPIGAGWGYCRMNFDLHERARINIFGNYDGIQSTALDMARLGWLWRSWGNWAGEQIVPESWLGEATRVAPNIRANCPEEQWQYGHGFWTNERGLIWPDLPRDSYAASGAGRQHIWVCPSLDMVVVQSPGLSEKQHDENTGLLGRVVGVFS